MKTRSWWCLSAYLFAVAFTLGRGEASPRPASKSYSEKWVKLAAQQVPQKKESVVEPKLPATPQQQAQHDWLVRDRWADLMAPPAARGDPFDLASFSSQPPLYIFPSPPVQAPVVAPGDARSSTLLATDKKTSSHHTRLAHSPHHLNLQKNQDEIPDVTILSPLPTADSEDSKTTADDSSLTVPPPSKVDDNTNDIEMPGLTAAQSRQSQEKQNVTLSLPLAPAANSQTVLSAAKSALLDTPPNQTAAPVVPVPPATPTVTP